MLDGDNNLLSDKIRPDNIWNFIVIEKSLYIELNDIWEWIRINALNVYCYDNRYCYKDGKKYKIEYIKVIDDVHNSKEELLKFCRIMERIHHTVVKSYEDVIYQVAKEFNLVGYPYYRRELKAYIKPNDDGTIKVEQIGQIELF